MTAVRFFHCAFSLATLWVTFNGRAGTAEEIFDETGVRGGLVVQVGVGDGGELTAALRPNERYQVHAVDTDPGKVKAAREFLLENADYGSVAVDRFDGAALPYIDNLVNLLVSEDIGAVSEEEVLRVLAPKGVGYFKKTGSEDWTKLVKEWPTSIDEWTHFLHGPDGNAVAHDDEVGPPRHMQWVGSPRWSRHHDRMASMSALVTSGGRLFYVMDEGSRISIQLPSQWKLIARDAFNGTVLWKRDVPDWHNHLWPLKSGPTQLARRLVSIGEEVYATLGIAAPVSAVDAATGEILREYAGTEQTEEIIASGENLFLLVNEAAWELKDFSPLHNTGDQARVREGFAWNETPRKVTCVVIASGEILWRHESKVAPLTLAVDEGQVYFHDGEKVVALARDSGEIAWQSKPAGTKASMTFNFGPKLVINDGVVLFAGGDRKMHAIDSTSGKELWTSDHEQGGYQSPEDLLVLKSTIWTAPLTKGNDTGIFTGRDVRTGKVVKQFAPDVETYWFHHRCYIAKATDNFLMPSRTGTEFIDPETEHWDINHWVRGGCLYGVMPANGLTYAPPHNCACYPEAKLYGFNALAAHSASRKAMRDGPDKPAAERLEKGLAFDAVKTAGAKGTGTGWPAFRHDSARSGHSEEAIAAELKESWQTQLSGRISAITAADGRLFLAEIDRHSVVGLDGASGEVAWRYTTGGRVDSPPTIDGERVVFGSADGWVYCLRASDGELAWRFRGAPRDRRMGAFEQVESAWPVQGSVLIHDNVVGFIAGRSNFLDGGLRYYRLDADTGELITETVIDELDPNSGENLQTHVKTLQMPVGLPDILSCDGSYVYMRSQKFDLDGNRLEIGPNSGDTREQVTARQGDGTHLFAPMGFLDDTYFHRAYWVYGSDFAGGHNGYYQAGKVTPSARMLVFDKDNVYGFGRKPEYYKWTTTLEHHLFSASRIPPVVPKIDRKGEISGVNQVGFKNSESLNPTNSALSVEAWVKTTASDGVIVARGGPAAGYALLVREGIPRFSIRANSVLVSIGDKQKLGDDWTHLVGVLAEDKSMTLYVNGKQVAKGETEQMIDSDPKQGLEIGADAGTAVGTYASPFGFTGLIDELNIYRGPLSAEEIAARYATPTLGAAISATAEAVLACSFDNGDAQDASGNSNHGTVANAVPVEGQHGTALRFVGSSKKGKGKGKGPQKIAPTLVEFAWSQEPPLIVRSMLIADKTLVVLGPPDLVDEEESFTKIATGKEDEVLQDLTDQAAAFDGAQGSVMRTVSTTTGETIQDLKFDFLPVWDGMAVADGRLYIATSDGRVVALAD